MYTQEITVNNEVGLHARPATFFIQKANEFKSGIWEGIPVFTVPYEAVGPYEPASETEPPPSAPQT